MTNIIEKLWKVASECEKVRSNVKYIIGKHVRLKATGEPIIINATLWSFVNAYNSRGENKTYGYDQIEYFDTESINAALLEVRREAFEAGYNKAVLDEATTDVLLTDDQLKAVDFDTWISQKEKEQ